ncbi:MAG: hypothetical protein ACLP1X_35325 [Polyangiaceae bacterium]
MTHEMHDRAAKLVGALRANPPRGLVEAVRTEEQRLAAEQERGYRHAMVDTRGVFNALVDAGVFVETNDGTEDSTDEFRAVVAWDLLCALSDRRSPVL